MAIEMKKANQTLAQNSDGQICARGWQDYMMETQFFLGEDRVDDGLKKLSNNQLVQLGLSAAEMLRLHVSAKADAALAAHQRKIAA